MAEELFAKGFRVFVESELVDLAVAANNGFAETKVRVDEQFGEIAGDGIDGESDAGAIASDHLLNDNAHSGLLVGEAALRPVGDGTVREEREIAIFDGCEDTFFANAIEKSFVLSGESSDGEIFKSR